MKQNKLEVNNLKLFMSSLTFSSMSRCLLGSRIKPLLEKSSSISLDVRETLLDWRLTRRISNPKTPGQMAEFPKFVWTYWDQGKDCAPAIVDKCISSQRLHFGDRHILLSDRSLAEYIDIPNYIVEKRHLMTTTHFSDIIRLLILKKYGGTWVDATVFISSSPSDPESGFFAFSRPHDPYFLSSWFLQARANSYIVSKWLSVLLDYWKSHDALIDYYLLHHLFEVEVLVDKKFSREWSKVSFKSHVEPHAFQSLLGRQYIPGMLNKVIFESDVHKLTYKFPEKFLSKGTVLEKFLGDEISIDSLRT